MNVWLTMVFLQLADLLTTLVFLSLGSQEANPIIRFFMRSMGALWGLLFAKFVIAGLLVEATFILKKSKLIKFANWGYMIVIIWNLFAIWARVLERHC